MASGASRTPVDSVYSRARMIVSLEINKRLGDEDRWRLLHAIPDLEWRAVVETLLEHIEAATQYVSDAGVSAEHGSIAHFAGQVSALRLLLASFEDLRSKGGNIS